MTATMNPSSGFGLDDDPLSGIPFVDCDAHFRVELPVSHRVARRRGAKVVQPMVG